jgi:hypothetical protein
MPTHQILGGKVQVYRRPNSSYWQCSTYLAGRNCHISTKQDSLQLAKEFAKDWYLTLRDKSRQSELISQKTFKQATAVFEREYGTIAEGKCSPAGSKDIRRGCAIGPSLSRRTPPKRLQTLRAGPLGATSEPMRPKTSKRPRLSSRL